jgi:hypothetical protein
MPRLGTWTKVALFVVGTLILLYALAFWYVNTYGT